MEPYEAVVAACGLCGGEIYRGEAYYYLNGQAICRDCLTDFAALAFAPYLTEGA